MRKSMIVQTPFGNAMVNYEEISTIHPNIRQEGVIRMKDGFILVTTNPCVDLIRMIETQSISTPLGDKEE